jgi:hypothetical protein
VEVAFGMIAPKANIRGAKAQLGEAVLRKALERFASDGGHGLGAFIDLLDDLPDGVSQVRDARKIAAGLADALRAARDNDPIFGGTGDNADPGVLLTPPPGKRARISVISFIGLPRREQQQSFVNQLQLALFAWVKDHPAGNRPLAGLFVMDEAQNFAPSVGSTESTASTTSLAQQARKYGLGLIFATQAPKGLDNRISGNATTQFFGYLAAEVQIDAARVLAHTRGSDLADIGRLTPGQFYGTSEGTPFRKIKTPMCLSYDGGPLTAEEVLRRTARPVE